MEYKAPKLRLKKRKMEPAKIGKESDIGGKMHEAGKSAKLKMAEIPIEEGKKEGKIIRLKRKMKSSPVESKFMRKDYERETNKIGKQGSKYMMEKGRLESERDIYKKILRLK